MRCRSCSDELDHDDLFCRRCGSPVAGGSPSRAETAAAPEAARDGGGTGTPPSSAPAVAGRFLPGAVLDGRYRIVSILGRGGMGEVYRAEDLKLGATVALKFLPAALARNPGRLERLLGEVKIARQISHPNICRVFDVGETDGQHFFSMEYIDGEDLATLLRRIGRLPAEKALEIARQLCAGLAAAHELHVLHRDLKPANVMLDGRGRARITDFGLAILAGELEAEQVRAGTPAYMAPEQHAGDEVSRRSDLYSLGLVLYELFTGRPAFADAAAGADPRSSRPSSPRELVSDLDPAVERVILDCLEPEPAARPASALAVAAALPGGDPLAFALRAGETPAPELVAQAGGVGSLTPARAWSGLAGVLIGLALVVPVASRTKLASQVSTPLPPEVLQHSARQLLARIGYDRLPLDRQWGFAPESDWLSWLESAEDRPLDREALDAFALRFWYRESPFYLERRTLLGATLVGNPEEDPPLTRPGMVHLALTPDGRLRSLLVVPPAGQEPATPELDWSVLLTEAGLDPGRFRAVEPQRVPPVFAERRVAWEGRAAEFPDLPLRVEGASYGGRPVWFRLFGPWGRGEASSTMRILLGILPSSVYSLTFLFFAVVSIGLGLLARRNLLAGRADRSGAAALALVVFTLALLSWVFASHHVPTVREFLYLTGGVAGALLLSMTSWVGYLALEPYLRRWWPDLLISWSRLLAGRIRDPRVGRDLLGGCLGGLGWALIMHVPFAVRGWSGDRPPYVPLAFFPSPGGLLGFSLSGFVSSFAIVGVLPLLYFALRERRRAMVAFLTTLVVLFTVIFASWFALPMALVEGLLLSALVGLLIRGGLLTFVVAMTMQQPWRFFPISLDPEVFYFRSSLLWLLLILAVALYGFRTALGSRPLFGEPDA